MLVGAYFCAAANCEAACKAEPPRESRGGSHGIQACVEPNLQFSHPACCGRRSSHRGAAYSRLSARRSVDYAFTGKQPVRCNTTQSRRPHDGAAGEMQANRRTAVSYPHLSVFHYSCHQRQTGGHVRSGSDTRSIRNHSPERRPSASWANSSRSPVGDSSGPT